MEIAAVVWALIRRAWLWLAGHREFLMTLAVAGIAAFLWYRLETTIGERDRALAWRQMACTSVSAAQASPADCQKRISYLVAFEHDTLASSNALRAAAADEHVGKAAADTVAADRDRAVAGAAQLDMEKANGSIGQDDIVGGDWFAKLNRTGGLRAPGR